MSSTTSTIQDVRPIISGSRLYNILYPVMLGASILFLIVIVFITPSECAIDTAAKGVTVSGLRQVEKYLGTTTMFGLKDPRAPGAMTGKPV